MSLILASSAPLAVAAEKVTGPMSPIVKEEFRITKEDLKQSLTSAKKRIADVEAARGKVVAQSKEQAATDLNWADHLRKYDILIGARYVDEKGEYSPSMEITAHDVDNLNKLFDEYLRSRPFVGRVTASKARKVLNEGQEQLKELSSVHGDPTIGNNSELEIMAKVKLDAEREIKKTLMLAEQLNFDLTKTEASSLASEQPAAPAVRAPASKK